MKPPAFRYVAPRSIEEIRTLLAQYGAEARLLAGGQSLVPLMNLRIVRPSVLIDLNQCPELQYIERRGCQIAYGAMTPQMNAMVSPMTQAYCPLVAQALAHAGPVAVRNRATVGGTLAHADRVAELPAVAITLDATLMIEGSGGAREVTAGDFFLGDLTTAIEPGEFLREARFPVLGENSWSSFAEVSVRQEGVAVVGLAVYVARDEGGRVRRAGLTAMGIESKPIRLRACEAALQQGGLETTTLDDVVKLASQEIDPVSDLYASAGYRKQVVAALLKRALESALKRQSP
jgi:carbon-monoxide dehydrogenase medium subunit